MSRSKESDIYGQAYRIADDRDSPSAGWLLCKRPGGAGLIVYNGLFMIGM